MTVPSLLRMRVFRRIDYQIATPGLAGKAKRVEIYKARRFSDHAPLIIDYSGRL
jgi:exodeoxyribonuclease-3